MMSQDARDKLRTASEVFHKPVDAQERAHCRLDLHKAQRGDWAPSEFVARWGDRLDVLLSS